MYQDDLRRISRPSYTQNIIMVSGVGSMEIEGREFSHKMIRRTPHLDVWPMRHSNVSVWSKVSWKYKKKTEPGLLSIGRKLDIFHRFMEVEVVQYNTALSINQKGTSIWVIQEPISRGGRETRTFVY